jgi:hypothetical protein
MFVRPGPVRVAFGAPLRLQGSDYAELASQVERAFELSSRFLTPRVFTPDHRLLKR